MPRAADARSRLLAGAAVGLAAGAGRVTVEGVITSAGVSRSTFYAHFTNIRECIQVAHREASERLVETIRQACAGAGEWPDKVTAGVRAAVRFAVQCPDEASLLLFLAAGADPERAASVLFTSNEHLVDMLRAGRERSARGAEMPELVECMLVAGVSSAIAARLVRDSAEDLFALEPELVHFMLLPYVEPAEARRIAACP